MKVIPQFLHLAAIGFLATSALAQEATPETTKPAETTETSEKAEAAEEVTVVMTTSEGEIQIELDSKNAPKTVENFLKYIDAGYYDGTIFHRVINGFMIQGGGFKIKNDKLEKQKTNAPIKNESAQTPSNLRGTIAMARTPNPHSANAQFFINVADNTMLDYPNNGGGYATFGKVTKGMEIVDKIKAMKTGVQFEMKDFPEKTITITSIKRAK